MKHFPILLPLLFLCLINQSPAQQTGWYPGSSGELIVSYGLVEQDGDPVQGIPRLSLFYHQTWYLNRDLGEHAGIMAGLGIKNIGYITEENDIRTKRRSYTAGIPVAFKIGNLPKHFYVYGGAEGEFLFHFKEKVIDGRQKQKTQEWFSKRTHTFMPSFLAGLQFPGGLNLRVKVYPGNFMNRNYSYLDNGNRVYPYRGLSTRLMYLSLSYQFRLANIRKAIQPEGTFVDYVPGEQ